MRYAELQKVCRQYPEYQRAIRRRRAGIVDKPARRAGRWKRPDPTGDAAAGIADDIAWMEKRVKAIERCARRCAEPAVASAVLRSVTREMSYEAVSPPCGRSQFYRARMWFFAMLDGEMRE